MQLDYVVKTCGFVYSTTKFNIYNVSYEKDVMAADLQTGVPVCSLSDALRTLRKDEVGLLHGGLGRRFALLTLASRTRNG